MADLLTDLLSNPETQRMVYGTVVILVTSLVVITIFNAFVRFLERHVKTAKGRFRAVRRVFQVIVYLVALVLLLWNFDVDITGVLAGLGVGALIIGFAVRDILENWVSGILMIGGHVFRVGDVIRVGDLQGVVTDMSLRTTTLKTYDRKEIIIPNSTLIKANVVNLTGGKREAVASYVFTIDYSFDPEDAERIIENVLNDHPSVIVDLDRQREIRFITRIRDWTTEIEVLFWVDDPENAEFIKSRIAEQVRRRFDEAGILPPIPVTLRADYLRPRSVGANPGNPSPENRPSDD